MSSWREGASDLAQSDADALFSAALELAEKMLAKRGEFYPFGVDVDTEDELAMFGAAPGLGEHPASLDVLDGLVEGARSRRDALRAVAVVADVTLQGGRDAVRIEVEHREGLALEILVPYARRRLTGRVTFDDMSVSEGPRRVWSE